MYSAQLKQLNLLLKNGKIVKDSISETDSPIAEKDFQISQGLRMFGESISITIDGALAYTIKEPHLPPSGTMESGIEIHEAGKKGVEFFIIFKAVYMNYR